MPTPQGEQRGGDGCARAEEHDELMHSGGARSRRGGRRDRELRCPERGATEPPHRLCKHHDDGRFDAREERGHTRQGAVSDVAPRDHGRDRRGRHDERCPCDDDAREPGAQPSDVDRELGRRGPGDDVRGAEHVEEPVAIDPAPALHDLLFHHRDVHRGTAERGGAEAEEKAGQLAERATAGSRVSGGDRRRRRARSGRGHRRAGARSA